MISNKHIKKTDSENANGHFSMSVQNDPACEGCIYYKKLDPNGGNAQKACHYILVEGHRRPCDPGKDCTVKVLGERVEYDPGRWCHDGRRVDDDAAM